MSRRKGTWTIGRWYPNRNGRALRFSGPSKCEKYPWLFFLDDAMETRFTYAPDGRVALTHENPWDITHDDLGPLEVPEPPPKPTAAEQIDAEGKAWQLEKLRDKFAAAALTGAIASPLTGPMYSVNFGELARFCWRCADDLLAEREKSR